MTPKPQAKTINEILDWQTHLTMEQAVLQDVSSTKNIHITEKMMLDAKHEAKQAITQAMLDIPEMQDESITRAGNSAQFNSISGQNMLRAEIRTAIKKMGEI